MSVSLDENTIRHIARLSRIELQADRIPELLEQFREILNYFDKLGELNVDEVEPLARAVDLQNVMAADAGQPSLPGEAALAQAPVSANRLFQVPKVLGDS